MQVLNANEFLDSAADPPSGGRALATDASRWLAEGDSVIIDLTRASGVTSAFFNAFFAELASVDDLAAADRIEWRYRSTPQEVLLNRSLATARAGMPTGRRGILDRLGIRRAK